MTTSANNELYDKIVERNLVGLVTPTEQKTLKNSAVAIFGMGGFGGIIAEILARAGVGKLSIVDFDVFDTSNQNRQIYAFCSTKGKMKVDVAEKFLKDINPDIVVEKHNAITDESLKTMLSDASVVVHAVDQAFARWWVSREAQKRHLPQVEGWAVPYCNVIVYNDKTPTWEEYYGVKGRNLTNEQIVALTTEERRQLTGQCLMTFANYEGIMRFVTPQKLQEMISNHRYTSFAPLVFLESSLLANEVIKILLGWGELALAPNWRSYDFHRHLIPTRI